MYEEDSQGHGLMWHAIVNGNSKIIPILAMHKARIDTDSRGNKTYRFATALEVVKAKMKDGSEPKAAIDYSDVIRNLLIVGCNPDEALENIESPIFTAIHHRFDHIFKILVDWGMADRDFSKPVIVVENYYPLCREITVKTIREYCNAYGYTEGVKIIDHDRRQDAQKKKALLFAMGYQYYFSHLPKDIVKMVCDYIMLKKMPDELAK